MTLELDSFLHQPRISALRLSPEADRLVVAVSTPDADEKRYVTALWEIDPGGARPPRRLTRSAEGEANPAFLPDASLLFTSKRPDPEAKEEERDTETAVLWRLPSDGGEAQMLARPAGGIEDLRVARDAGRVVLAAPVHPRTGSWEEDAEREKARKEAGVGARLYESFPTRYWDHWLGPRERRLWAASPPEREGERLDPQDLTPDPSGSLHEESGFDISPDGRMVVAAWWRTDLPILEQVTDLVAIDADTGERRTLRSDGYWYDSPVFSPDGARIAVSRSNPDGPYEVDLALVDPMTGVMEVITDGIDLWPGRAVWSPDGTAVYFTADERGECPIFILEVASREVTRLTASGAYTDIAVAGDGSGVFALRSTVDRPPHPVRLEPTGADQHPQELAAPGTTMNGLGTVERLLTSADDGTEIASWLVLPASGDGPAPLVVFIHGGPFASWNAWHWRWNPHVLAARGYAVLLPDPGLSTGYGQEFIERGWGRWGEEPFTDLMAAVDAAVTRPDIDGARTAAMGGSFGGYMANWVAGQTDRFRAIVTHASIWDLRAMHGTSDLGPIWDEREFGDPYVDDSRYRDHSPHRQVTRIRTPMLVIHGEHDHRCHISDAMRLFADLQRNAVEAKLLYFPDENHWILKPQNARVWYETVLAFLDHHVLGRDWERPELL